MNPLDRFAVIRTPDASQMSGAIHRFYGENRLKVAGKPASFNGHVNYLQLGDLGISFGGFGSDVELYFPNGTDRYAIPICVAGGGELRAGAQTVALDREQTGILTAGRSTSLSFVDAFETTVVQIDAEPLTRKLGGLIGFQPESQLVFEPALDFRRQTAGFWRRLVQFLISEVDSQGENVDKPGIIELEQTLMVALLRSTPHNFSHLLDGEPHRSAPWQVRRAEEYIEANWHRPITIEALAAATNSSARSLFHSFNGSQVRSLSYPP
jgi:hypothetical protein